MYINKKNYEKCKILEIFLKYWKKKAILITIFDKTRTKRFLEKFKNKEKQCSKKKRVLRK